MTEPISLSISSGESQKQRLSFDDNDDESVKNIKIYFQKKLNDEKKKRRRKCAILQETIQNLQQQFDNTEQDKRCKMYLQQKDKCLYLEEEKQSRDLFIKEILKLLKNRTEELRSLKNNPTFKNSTAATSYPNFDDSFTKTGFGENKKKRNNNLDSTQ